MQVMTQEYVSAFPFLSFSSVDLYIRCIDFKRCYSSISFKHFPFTDFTDCTTNKQVYGIQMAPWISNQN